MAKICEWCGKIISGHKGNTRFCSNECYLLDKTKDCYGVCQQCGKEFKKKKKKAVFCSVECRGAARRVRVQVKCEYCGIEFEKKKSDYERSEKHFCSPECHLSYGTEERQCKTCGKTFKTLLSTDRKYCSHNCYMVFSYSISNKDFIESFLGDEIAITKLEGSEATKEDALSAASALFFAKLSAMGEVPFEVIGEYKNAKTRIKCRCKEHSEIFYTEPRVLLDGSQGCKKCIMISKGEKRIASFLDMFGFTYTTQKTFEGCEDQRLLPFDFYLDNFNVLIEYDGEQHYAPVRFNGTKRSSIAKNFEDVQRRDKIKNEFCEKEGIKLIRIPYWELEEIEEYLWDRLVENGVIHQD